MKSCWVTASRARAMGTRKTWSSFPARYSLARFSMSAVSSPPAGPPWGGSYLMPPSAGGLWLGVMTMPSASPRSRSRLCSRMAKETAGVGVYFVAAMRTSTPLATSTSTTEIHAGVLSAWVSWPTKSGPSIPCALRWSHTACATASRCASLNDAFSAEPRCPLVPNVTRSPRSRGTRLNRVVGRDQRRHVDQRFPRCRLPRELVCHGRPVADPPGRASSFSSFGSFEMTKKTKRVPDQRAAKRTMRSTTPGRTESMACRTLLPGSTKMSHSRLSSCFSVVPTISAAE